MTEYLLSSRLCELQAFINHSIGAVSRCRDYTDISIAVATPKGLVVPVLRNVDELDFAGVEKVRPAAWAGLQAAQFAVWHFACSWGDTVGTTLPLWAEHCQQQPLTGPLTVAQALWRCCRYCRGVRNLFTKRSAATTCPRVSSIQPTDYVAVQSSFC